MESKRNTDSTQVRLWSRNKSNAQFGREGLNGAQIQGITQPYAYIGTWKAMTGWHKEEMDLYSVSYLHVGMPKFWYSVDLCENQYFEDYARYLFKEQFRGCTDYLRHKTTLIHPETLLRAGVQIHKTVQRPGEFVITRAKGYHSGFNSGFNIAEAVNFALPGWIEIGEQAKFCRCIRESV